MRRLLLMLLPLILMCADGASTAANLSSQPGRQAGRQAASQPASHPARPTQTHWNRLVVAHLGKPRM